jgi:subtilisin family serine protease
VIRPDYSFSRVLNGFSALIEASAIPLIEADDDVAGVYPVRVAYPAAVSENVLARADYGAASGHRPEVGFSGVDGRGVTIALLDTGVDAAVPYLRGRVVRGIDIVGGSAGAVAAAKPDDPAQLERHGTQMAGLLVGGGGPSGLAGVATGANVLPIRVAGWQGDATGHWATYARSDQLIAGLDRAVDPNDDGDAHDGARVALVALAEPFAAFADGPEARAAAGTGDAPTGTSAARPATRLTPVLLKKSVRRGAVPRPRDPRGIATARSMRFVGCTAPATGARPSSSVASPARMTIRAPSVCDRVSIAPTVNAAGAPPGPATTP